MISLREVEVLARGGDGAVPRMILGPLSVDITHKRVAVIGANGSGKSTFGRLLNGLVTAASGRVSVAGLDVAREPAKVRAAVAMLFSDPAAQLIMPTAAEDVALSLRRRVRDPAERRRLALDLLATVGLTEHADVSVHQLSGGQRQLLALAGVLALTPRVLVLDEPTTLLDLHWRTVVNRIIRHQVAPRVEHIIEITHDLEAAADADHLLVIHQGLIMWDGNPEAGIEAYRELMTTGMVAND